MGGPRSISHRDRVIFVAPAVMLIAVPLILWLVAFLWGPEVPHHLLALFIFWVYIPGSIFGKPWFEADDFGYFPHGLQGWLIAILFYVAVSLVLSFILRLFLCTRRRI
jgi:hypothetical protein